MKGSLPIYRLMHEALSDLKTAGQLNRNAVIYNLAALTEAIPLELDKASRHKRGYARVLEDVKTRLSNTGAGWLVERAAESYIAARAGQLHKLTPAGSEARKVLHQALYLTFLDIRAEAYERRLDEAWHLADLFHNVPLQLEARPASSQEAVLDDLKSHAKRTGAEQWLNRVIDSIYAKSA